MWVTIDAERILYVDRGINTIQLTPEQRAQLLAQIK